MTTIETPMPTLGTEDLHRIVGDLLEGLDVENVAFWTAYGVMGAGIALAGASAESLPLAFTMLDDPTVETTTVTEPVVTVTVTGTYRGVAARISRGCINAEAALTRTTRGEELLTAITQHHVGANRDEHAEEATSGAQ